MHYCCLMPFSFCKLFVLIIKCVDYFITDWLPHQCRCPEAIWGYLCVAFKFYFRRIAQGGSSGRDMCPTNSYSSWWSSFSFIDKLLKVTGISFLLGLQLAFGELQVSLLIEWGNWVNHASLLYNGTNALTYSLTWVGRVTGEDML